MDKGSVYINTGRGMTTVEDDLREALKTRLLGAGLDVTRKEPIDKDHWIYTDKSLKDKVLLSCHQVDKMESNW